MRIGIVASHGFFGEYEGWPPNRAFESLITLARDCDEIGFESVWLFDHFLPVNSPKDRSARSLREGLLGSTTRSIEVFQWASSSRSASRAGLIVTLAGTRIPDRARFIAPAPRSIPDR